MRALCLVLIASASWTATGATPGQTVGRTSAFDEFNAWVRAYRTAPSEAARANLVAAGATLAAIRRSALYELIRTDPAAALREALPARVRAELPDSVAPLLERIIDARGDFVVTHACGPQGHALLRAVILDGERFEAYVHGHGREQTTCTAIQISGIAIDDRMAVRDGSLQGRFGARGGRPWTTGPKTVLYMRLDYPDVPGATLSVEAASQIMSDVSVFYAADTYGRIPSITATFTPVLRMPATYGSYTSRTQVEADALAAARVAGYDPNGFDLTFYQNTPQQVMSGFWGFARENARGVWMWNGYNWMHHAHEFGHNFGNRHANLWDAETEDPIGPGVNLEYGDVFDNMGNRGNLGQGHHHPWFKNRQDWLDDADVQFVSTSGVYRIQAIEFAPSGNPLALKIRRDALRNYWVFYRDQFPQSQVGALLTWGYNARVSSHLLDMTPGSASGINDAWDAPLVIGRSFLDWPANIEIRPLGFGGTTPETLDVQITLGQPNNAAPAVEAGGSQVIVLSGASVVANLNGAVSDPNDAPAIRWSLLEGPPVQIADPTAAATTATFDQSGAYFFVLEADDGVNPPMSDETTVLVVPPGMEALVLNAPHGGESWSAGGSARVRWDSAALANVMIELSRDGGATWETLTGSTPAAPGVWRWRNISGPASKRCLLRVSDAVDGAPSSVSSDFFAIVNRVRPADAPDPMSLPQP